MHKTKTFWGGFFSHFFFLKSYNLTNPAHLSSQKSGVLVFVKLFKCVIFPLPDVTPLNSLPNNLIWFALSKALLAQNRNQSHIFSDRSGVFLFSCFLVTRVQKRISPQNIVWICSNYSH